MQRHRLAAFLRFHPPVAAEDAIRLSLDARIMPRQPGGGVPGLSAVQLRWVRAGGAWVVEEAPVHLAA